MDKEGIKSAAQEAINDLQLDCEVAEITSPMGKDVWCIQFTGSYGQFCDSLHDKEGNDNSARVVREKIKRFFLKQRKPARIVRGRGPSRMARASGGSNLLNTLFEVGEGALKQAARITGEVVERAATLNRTVLETEADWIQTVSPTAAELIRPSAGRNKLRSVEPPERPFEPPSAQTVEQPSTTAPRTRTGIVKVGGKTKKTGKKRASEKTRPQATKKRAAKTATSALSKKSATKKKSLKSGRKAGKKVAGKKSGSKKSRRVIKNFF